MPAEILHEDFIGHDEGMQKDVSQKVRNEYSDAEISDYSAESALYLSNAFLSSAAELRNMTALSASVRPAPRAILLAMSPLTRSSGL